jgi:hypothetical protein
MKHLAHNAEREFQRAPGDDPHIQYHPHRFVYSPIPVPARFVGVDLM